MSKSKKPITKPEAQTTFNATSGTTSNAASDTNPNRLRCALYARVSTKDKGQDTANQLLPLRELADKRGWIIVREYIEDVSASGRAKRIQFGQMMTDADGRKFDVLLFWSLDRFSREGVAQTLFDLRRLTDAGVAWYSLQESETLGIDTLGPFREVLIALIAAIAQLETNRRSERAQAAIAKARSEGKRLGKPAISLDEDKLWRLHQEGYSQPALARYFKVSRGTIGNRIRELHKRYGNGKQEPQQEKEN